jgi:hypothetical protein
MFFMLASFHLAIIEKALSRIPETGDSTAPKVSQRIPAERAYWILDYYRRHATCLDFGGIILGEFAACRSVIGGVSADFRSISVKLFANSGNETWERSISLDGADFFLAQMSEPSFEQLAGDGWHSVLQIAFPDFTILFFAEQLH